MHFITHSQPWNLDKCFNVLTFDSVLLFFKNNMIILKAHSSVSKNFLFEELKFTDPLIIFVGEGTERSLMQCREDYSERKGDGTKVKFSTFLKLDA